MVYPPIMLGDQNKDTQNQTSNEKMHKWWSFHSLKEKVKSFFKNRQQNSKDETQNPIHVLENQQQQQQQLWPGNFIFAKFSLEKSFIGIDFYFWVFSFCMCNVHLI